MATGIKQTSTASARLAVCAAFFVLGGCATHDAPSNQRLAPGHGTVVGSVTYKGSFSAYGVHYKQIDGEAKGRFANHHSATAFYPPKGHFNSEDYSGVVFSTPLPAGEYELFGWSILSGITTVLSAKPFSIRFKIGAGETLYLGNFHFTQTSSYGLAVTGATLTYKDALERDLPILKRKFQSVAEIPIARTVAPDTNIEGLGGPQSIEHTRWPVFILMK